MSKVTLAMLLVLAAGEAAAAAARVDFAYGNVTVSGPDGREQALVRDAELDNGDTVRTAEGRAQLRFQDGAYVSLQPNSEFAIRDGIPYAIDFMNPAPDMDVNSLTPHYFEWVVGRMADLAIKLALEPRPQAKEMRWHALFGGDVGGHKPAAPAPPAMPRRPAAGHPA